MEPDVSRTNTSSLGAISSGWTRSGGCKQQGEVARVGEHRVFDPAAGHSVLEDEILVGDDGLVAQFDDCLSWVGTVDRHIVGAGFQVIDRDTRIQVDLDGDIVPRARAFRRNGRSEARRVRHAAARHVARRHHHRKIERIDAGFVRHSLDVSDLDLYGGARKDIGDGLGEDVGTLLIEQGCDAAGAAGLLVDLACFIPRFNEAADGAVSDLHGHIVDRGIGRQREGVDGLDLFGEGVVKLLGDGDACQRTGNANLHVSVAQRADSLGSDERARHNGIGGRQRGQREGSEK